MEEDLEWFTAAISGDILAWGSVPSHEDQICSRNLATHSVLQ